MGFTYPDKFTYLNTFVMQVAQRCSDNRGPTVLVSRNLVETQSLHIMFTTPIRKSFNAQRVL